MKQYYEYMWTDNDGNEQVGTVFAESEDDALGMVKKWGIVPHTINHLASGSIKDLRQKGLLSTLPIPVLVELLASEVKQTMELVASLQPGIVAKQVQAIARRQRPDPVAICPYHDHESEENCHKIGETTERNLNDVFGNLCGVFQ